jgi:succinyl-CoA synthetase beta subunit
MGIIGILGSAAGLYFSTQDIIQEIRDHPNPFEVASFSSSVITLAD